MGKGILFCAVFFTSIFGFSQKTDYSIALIPDSLKANANAVIRLNQRDVTVLSQRKMRLNTKRVVTVYNERGQYAIDAFVNYDKSSSVNTIEAVVYNAFGKEIKKLRRSDFKDQSATDGATIFSDNRVIHLEYTPTEYPFTIVFESEKVTSNTAFIYDWMPISDYYVSIQKSYLNVYYPDNLGFKKKEFNFSKFKIEKTTDTSTQLSYAASNIVAQKVESNSPAFIELFPRVMLGLEYFNLEGVDGNAKTWKEYGKWFSENILTGTDYLSDETKIKIKALVGNETDLIKKSKIVYKFVQDKTRYVSIQVGIGGFKPMLAKDVDRLSYGDCKALSNYTKALLKEVGVDSYYTELYGSSEKTDIQSDFTSLQGNHVILAIPKDNNYVFLECTSQTNPFGYQGNFTDDREVLVIKPDGGEIVRTKIYHDKENTQISKGSYAVSENGEFSGKVAIVSEGTQYTQKARLESLQPTDKESHYKEYWGNINNLKVKKIAFDNDKEKISFTENAEINATGYGIVNGAIMMFPLNAFNQSLSIPQRYRTRNFPLEIERGFFDQDEIEITLPENYTIDAKPNNFEIKDKYGEYKAEITVVNPSKIIYKRSLLINKGLYEKSDYENYRKFREQIAKADNSKIVLTKKQG